MGKPGQPAALESEQIAELREEIASLKDHIRLLVDVIDEVREELSWLARNGLPAGEPLPPTPVLKQMAADPCADDWGERLIIERGNVSNAIPEFTEPKNESSDKADTGFASIPPGRLF